MTKSEKRFNRQVAKTLRENTFEEGKKETPRGEGKTISQLSQRDSQREKIYGEVPLRENTLGKGKRRREPEGRTLFQLPQRDGRWYAYRVSLEWIGKWPDPVLCVSGTLSRRGDDLSQWNWLPREGKMGQRRCVWERSTREFLPCWWWSSSRYGRSIDRLWDLPCRVQAIRPMTQRPRDTEPERADYLTGLRISNTIIFGAGGDAAGSRIDHSDDYAEYPCGAGGNGGVYRVDGLSTLGCTPLL